MSLEGTARDGNVDVSRALSALALQLHAARGPAACSTGYHLARADWQLLAGLFIASRLWIFAGLLIAYAANTSRVENGPSDLFCNWDCDWYVGIAEHGYSALGEIGASGAANWAFFPLLPIGMGALSSVTGLSVVFCGLIIAQIGWGAGLYLAFLYGRDRQGIDFARHLAIVYTVWPFAVHASIPMTEALFVPLSIGAFVFARRGDWLMAAVIAVALSATRTVGVVLVLPYLFLAITEFGLWRVLLIRPGTERAVLAIGATGLGLGLFMLYLHGLTGDALAFSHNQVAWGRTFQFPWMTVIDELNPATIGVDWLYANVLDVASGLGGFAALVFLWSRGARAEALLAAVTLVIAFDTGNASSLPRYTGGLFAVLLAVALWSDRPLARLPVYVVLLAGSVSLSVAWGLEQFYVM